MSRIDVQCDENDEGWICEVTVDPDSKPSKHEVTLPRDDYQDLSGESATPEQLIEESFYFLLEREPKNAILSSFEIRTIETYFPEYSKKILKRLRS